MITGKSWMSGKTKGKLRAARFLYDTLALVDIATDEDAVSSALDLVEHASRQIAERGLAGQSVLLRMVDHDRNRN